MENPLSSIRDTFFDNLDDAKQVLRLFDFLPNAYLYVKDVSGRFVGANEPWLRMRGFQDATQVIGKTDRDLHPIYWARRYQDEDRRVMESGSELPNQVWLVPAGDGVLSTFVSSKIPIRGRDGKVIGIAGIMYEVTPPPIDSPGVDPISVAIKIIADGFCEPLEVSHIARRVDLSVSQFNRRFRARYSVSPSKYIQQLRINEAGRILSDTDASIAEVASASGFYDQSHLTRAFRQWMKVTPTEFRRRSRDQG
ncbi:MAG: AraC family transcriptional regulator [Planctomycetota bacterium]